MYDEDVYYSYSVLGVTSYLSLGDLTIMISRRLLANGGNSEIFGTKNVLVGEMRILVAKKEVMGSNFGRTFLNPLGMLLSELNYLNVVLNVQVQEVKGT